MMQKLHLKLLALSIIALMAIAGCSPGQADPEGPVQLTVCYSSLSAHQAVGQYALDHGIFERYGLDVELVYIEGGSTAATALIARDVELCFIAGSAVVNAAVAGEDVRIISGLVNTYIYSLIVQPEIETVEDLRGKNLAISDFGGSSDTATRVILESFGMDPDEDVAILPIGGTSTRIAALEAGEVAASVISPPRTVVAVNAGFVELLRMSDLNNPYQHTSIATTAEFIDGNRETALNFLRAVNDSIWSMKQDREGVYETIGTLLELDPVDDAEALREAFEVSVTSYLPFPTYPTIAGVQVLLDALFSENEAAALFTPNMIVDTTLLDDLEDDGFFQDLESQ
jgi:NitT/TauT family transport system substrate-binding protein